MLWRSHHCVSPLAREQYPWLPWLNSLPWVHCLSQLTDDKPLSGNMVQRLVPCYDSLLPRKWSFGIWFDVFFNYFDLEDHPLRKHGGDLLCNQTNNCLSMYPEVFFCMRTNESHMRMIGFDMWSPTFNRLGPRNVLQFNRSYVSTELWISSRFLCCVLAFTVNWPWCSLTLCQSTAKTQTWDFWVNGSLTIEQEDTGVSSQNWRGILHAPEGFNHKQLALQLDASLISLIKEGPTWCLSQVLM